MPDRAVPCMWMRGGTSKGGYFLKDDLPAGNQIRGHNAERDKSLANIYFGKKIADQRLKITGRKYRLAEEGMGKPVAIHDEGSCLIEKTLVLL